MDEQKQLGSAYVLDTLLGEGASGHVWAGHHRDGQRWAFKVLRPELGKDAGIVQRFVQERSLLASIRHDHVVQVHDLVVEGDTLAIVMDLVDGSDLRAVLRERGALTPGQVARWGSQIAAALQSAHRQGVVHRDVKPENVLITGEAEARLTDFGIARLVDGAHRTTMMLGTPQYMAPEIAEGREPTAAADLYSLGAMLYEMCCGVPPFAGRGSAMATLRAHAYDEPGRPEGVPDRLWAVICRLVLKDPTRRPASAGQVANDLAGVADDVVGAPAAPTLTAPPPPAGSLSPQEAHTVMSSWAAGLSGGATAAGASTVLSGGVSPVPGFSGIGSPYGVPGAWASGGSGGIYPGAPGYAAPGYGAPALVGQTPQQRVPGRGVFAGVAAGLVVCGLAAGGYLLTRDDEPQSVAAPATPAAPPTPTPTSPAAPAPGQAAMPTQVPQGGQATVPSQSPAPSSQQMPTAQVQPPAAPAPRVQTFVPPQDQAPAPTQDASSDQARQDYADKLVRNYLRQGEGGALTRPAMSTYFTPTVQWYQKPQRWTRDTLYDRVVKSWSTNGTSFSDPQFVSFAPGVSYGSGVADRIVYYRTYTRSSGKSGAIYVTYTLLRDGGDARITEVTERNA